MENSQLQDKLYFSIGEVKDMTGVEPHVLRYWETEFSSFRPKKSRGGQRTYTKKDIEIIRLIKQLLYEEKFTIKGARHKLREKIKNLDEELTSHPHLESSHTKENHQLSFVQVEQSVEAQLNQRDFLLHLRKKLIDISKSLRKIL
ncbi:MAG: MerR family transcriptional regulator [Candidatus Aureabacteria bacterium]|nr:MerR family transcriptional regulator [Candidatus Auribacterota bacterium]